MFMIGDVDPVWKKLVEDTKKALDLGVEVCKPYSTIGDIGYAINTFAKSRAILLSVRSADMVLDLISMKIRMSAISDSRARIM